MKADLLDTASLAMLLIGFLCLGIAIGSAEGRPHSAECRVVLDICEAVGHQDDR